MGRRLKIGAAVAACAVGMAIWSMLSKPLAPVEEYEKFIYNVSFTYWGSEDNLPIENVVIGFPHPNVENQTESIFFGVIWGLYWLDEENMSHLQATETTIYALMENRTKTLRILMGPLECPSIGGPKSTWVMDKLYPREVFRVSGGIEIPAAYGDKLTLKDFDDNEGRSSASFAHLPDPNTQDVSEYGAFNRPIRVSFWAQLCKPLSNGYEVIETFSRSIDNDTWGMFWLYPL